MARYELSSEKCKVNLGDMSFTKYTPVGKDPHTFYHWSRSYFAVSDIDTFHPKEVNKALHEAFGSKIPYRFSAAMFNTFIRDNVPKEGWFALTHLGHRWNKLNIQLVHTATEHNHLVQQAFKDNTLNLLPLMLHMKKDTQQLKEHFGKGLWKKLAKTSKTRMKYLAPLIKVDPRWVEVRTGVLERRHSPYTEENLIAAKVAPTVKLYDAASHIIIDSCRMARGLGYDVNPSWSYKRWEEEHDELVKRVNMSRFSPKPFCDVEVYEKDGYTFTLLNSPALIGMEGTIMGHCVGGYAAQAQAGKYAVFKVEGSGDGERATLGLRKHYSENRFEFEQCYSRFNRPVSEKLKEAAHKVTKEYNESLRLRNGWTAGEGDEDPRPVLDNRWQNFLLNL